MIDMIIRVCYNIIKKNKRNCHKKQIANLHKTRNSFHKYIPFFDFLRLCKQGNQIQDILHPPACSEKEGKRPGRPTASPGF